MHYNYFPGRINEEKTLNSATLATATHKELIGVSDGTGAQVGVWMINKCKAQMI